MSKWKISKKQYSRYEELLKQYNKMRKQITTAHKNLEQVTPNSRMPSLVVPQRQRKISMKRFNISGRMLYNLKVRYLNKMVKGGLKGFYKAYKESYLQLYREYIIKEMPETPRGKGGEGVYYSKDQINNASEEMARFMHLYNKVANMNPYIFAVLVKKGEIPEFKRLYNELLGDFTIEESFVDKMSSAIFNAKWKDKEEALSILTGLTKKDKIKIYKKMSGQTGKIYRGKQTIEQNAKDRQN